MDRAERKERVIELIESGVKIIAIDGRCASGKSTLTEDVKRVIKDEVRMFEENGIRDWSTIKSTLKDNLRDYIFQRTKRNPMIRPIIMEV